MPTGTAVVVNDRPAGHHFTGSFTIDPGLIAAGANEFQTVPVPGVVIGDIVIVRCSHGNNPGLFPALERVSTNGNIVFYLENNSAAGIDQNPSVYNFVIIRGTTGPLR